MLFIIRILIIKNLLKLCIALNAGIIKLIQKFENYNRNFQNLLV